MSELLLSLRHDERWDNHAMKGNRAVWGIFVVGAVGGMAYAGFQAASSLYLNGNLASTGVIELKGTAYIPVKDVAKALNMGIVKSAKGYELSPAGGANQVQGFEGKVSDELFNGFQRFKVVEVIRGKKYVNRFSGDKQEVTPFGAEKDLVIVVCRVKNGMKEAMDLGLPGGSLSGLTDMGEHSYQFRTGLSIDCPERGVHLLPGSACDFALTFDVPEDAVLKDLVYEISNLGGGPKGPKPFRVSLRT
jgi:hypothetical protein